jgi:hypothetical protein
MEQDETDIKKLRCRARLLAYEWACEIEKVDDGYMVWGVFLIYSGKDPHRVIRPRADPCEGDRFCRDWPGVLDRLYRYAVDLTWHELNLPLLYEVVIKQVSDPGILTAWQESWVAPRTLKRKAHRDHVRSIGYVLCDWLEENGEWVHVPLRKAVSVFMTYG